MEYKHFSHNHDLIFHQVPPEAEIICSGCNSPGTGPVYVCWPCHFFLHEQCFKASRSMKHPYHPTHPLTLVPYPTYPSNSYFCNSCNLAGTGFSYTCSDCEYDLHVRCAYLSYTAMPQTHPIPNNYPLNNQTTSSFNAPVSIYAGSHVAPPPPAAYPKVEPVKIQLTKPQTHNQVSNQSEQPKEDSKASEDNYEWNVYNFTTEIEHKSHPDHSLKLLRAPTYTGGEFTCNACFRAGNSFVYHCKTCQFDLHVNCSSLPEAVLREDHKHALTLLYSPKFTNREEGQKDVVFACDVCREIVDERCWLYYCKLCDYGTHVDCVTVEETPQPQPQPQGGGEVSELEAILSAQVQLERMKLEMEMAKQTAQMIANIGHSVNNLA